MEYRQLNILRIGLLRGLQETSGEIPLEKFRKMLRSIIRNISGELESLFIEQVRTENRGTVDYQRVCEVVNLYQYHLYFVK